ncbi:MAG: hypothetical protein JWR16_237 [Nevskia sp.]|nr:hypothetical protein [Nevskia sp.]
MSNPWKICVALLSLASAMPTPAAASAVTPDCLHRGDFVRVRLLSGSVYHLRLSGLDEVSLVGGSGNTSVHLPRSEIASIEHETAPSAALNAPSASTTMLGLLGLSAASLGAARSFGAGHACNGSTSGC